MGTHRHIMIRCPFCGEEEVDPQLHFPTPPDEGCPYTPMTRSADTPAPPGVEGTERQGRRPPSAAADCEQIIPAEGRESANPATTHK